MIEKIVRGLVTLGLTAACVWMWIDGNEPPDALLIAWGASSGTHYGDLRPKK